MRCLVLLLALLAGCAPTVVPMGPPVAPPQLAASAITAADGARLPLRVTLPDGPPRAALVALHGFGDYANAFTEPAKRFARDGIATYAYDQRGFGEAPNRGDWAGEATLAADAKAAVRLVRARHPGLPVFLLGESMGGAVALAAVAGPDPAPVDGVALISPAVWGRATLGWLPRNALALFSYTIPWFPLSGQGLNIRASDNIEMLRAFSRDPLVMKQATVGTVHGLVDLMDKAYATITRVPLPMLLQYGARDEVIPPKPVCRVLAGLPPRPPGRWRFALYPEGWHMLGRDLGAEAPLSDIAAWVLDRATALPSGAEQFAGTAVRPAAILDLPICRKIADELRELPEFVEAVTPPS